MGGIGTMVFKGLEAVQSRGSVRLAGGIEVTVVTAKAF